MPDDLKFIAIAESGLLNVTSPKNAIGFWQFLEEPAKKYGQIKSAYVKWLGIGATESHIIECDNQLDEEVAE